MKISNLLRCKHDYEIEARSNALQQDDMGYPLRLFCVKCSKCGKQEQKWIDVCEEELQELKDGRSVLVTWKNK